MIGPWWKNWPQSTRTVKVAKVDVDSNRQVAGKLGVMSIPTLIMFKDGEEIDQIIGMTGKEQLKQKINQHLT